MCIKTCLRRLTKHISTSFESVEAHSAWEDGSGMDFANPVAPVNDREEVIDVFEDVSGNKEEITVDVVETEGVSDAEK